MKRLWSLIWPVLLVLALGVIGVMLAIGLAEVLL
jgi:hypothetical protein